MSALVKLSVVQLEITEDAAEMIRSMLNCGTEEFCEKYKKYKEAELEFKKVYEPFREKLLKLYKEQQELPKSILMQGSMKLVYVSPSTRTSIDSKKLKEEEPELAKKYTKYTNVDATVRIEGL